jgi:hypothetical protein
MNMKTNVNFYNEYVRIEEMERKGLKDALMRFPNHEYEFIKEEDAENDYFEVDDSVPIISVQNKYTSGTSNIAVTKVCIVRDTIEIWGFDSEHESYEYQVCYDTDDVQIGHLHWLIDYLPEPPEPQETPETKKTPEQKYTYMEMENAVLIAADIYNAIYEKSEGFTDAVSKICDYAVAFEKELNWQEFDERDYIDELEKFEKKILAEL